MPFQLASHVKGNRPRLTDAGKRWRSRLAEIGSRLRTREANTGTKQPARADIWWCMAAFLVMRVVLTVWSILAVRAYPIEVPWDDPMFEFYQEIVPGGYGDGRTVSDHLLWPWYRWDSYWYLEIAVEGYDAEGRGAFGPLYPALIRGLAPLLGGHYMVAALVISNLATMLVIWLLYQEAYSLFDRGTARRSVLYLLGFPVAFFLLGAYAESVFMAFLLLAWRAASSEKWVQAGLWGAACVLVRFHGIALLLPGAYLLWQRGALSKRKALAMLAIPLALAAWSLYTRFGPVMAFPWQVQARVWGDHSAWPWEGAIHNLLTILGYYPLRNLSVFSLSLDLLSAALFLTLTVAAARVLPTEHVLLMGALLFVALVRVDGYGWMRATSRYMLPIFPGFIVLARAGRRAAFHWPWISLSLALQAITSGLFFLWHFVA